MRPTQRLQTKYDSNQDQFKTLFSIPDADVAAGVEKDNSGCTKGLLWLKRACQFVITMMKKLQEDPSCTLYDAASSSYDETLKMFHGMFAYMAFSGAMKLCPSRESFFKGGRG